VFCFWALGFFFFFFLFIVLVYILAGKGGRREVAFAKIWHFHGKTICGFSFFESDELQNGKPCV